MRLSQQILGGEDYFYNKVELNGSKLNGATLTDANLSQADLAGAVLDDAQASRGAAASPRRTHPFRKFNPLNSRLIPMCPG
jgi:uncharacterized protein YjbI with pentapeptide repeats